MFDFRKVKTFNLTDLTGRTLKVVSSTSREEGIKLTVAFDVETHELFVLECRQQELSEYSSGTQIHGL